MATNQEKCYYGMEFQRRGSSLIHVVLWLDSSLRVKLWNSALHKSQGHSMDLVTMEVAPIYVAMSRVASLKGLYIVCEFRPHPLHLSPSLQH